MIAVICDSFKTYRKQAVTQKMQYCLNHAHGLQSAMLDMFGGHEGYFVGNVSGFGSGNEARC